MMRAQIECIGKTFHAEEKNRFLRLLLISKRRYFSNKISPLIRYHNFIDINKDLKLVAISIILEMFFSKITHLFFHFIRIYDAVMVDNKTSWLLLKQYF